MTVTSPSGSTSTKTTTKTSYTNILADMVGVGLSGVLIGGAMNGYENDPFYPPLDATNLGGDTADVCG